MYRPLPGFGVMGCIAAQPRAIPHQIDRNLPVLILEQAGRHESIPAIVSGTTENGGVALRESLGNGQGNGCPGPFHQIGSQCARLHRSAVSRAHRRNIQHGMPKPGCAVDAAGHFDTFLLSAACTAAWIILREWE